jgi:hypothetical protein
MAAILYLLGLFLMLVSVALAITGTKNPATMQVYGLTMETAAILFVGGVVTFALAAVISALHDLISGRPTVAELPELPAKAAPIAVSAPAYVQPAEVPAIEPDTAAVDETPSRIRFNPFTRKTTETAAGAVAVGAAAATVVASAPAAASSSAVDETIAALEKAKADISNAVGGIATVAEEKVEEVVEEVSVDSADDAPDDELYVLEEREIRGRPARILSDNTVEAETDDGWMRFENLEHLNEYLDAIGENA